MQGVGKGSRASHKVKSGTEQHHTNPQWSAFRWFRRLPPYQHSLEGGASNTFRVTIVGVSGGRGESARTRQNIA